MVQRGNKRIKMDDFVIRTSATKKTLLDEQAARFIYANNCQFRTVENVEFINFCEKLRPGYVPPSRKAIAGNLLDKVYDDENQKCINILSDKYVCMPFDGWSNIRNEPIVCACVINSGKVYLVDSIDTSGFSHTVEYLTDVVIKTINATENKLKCKVHSFVTDNAANMSKMRKELQEKDLNVITYGCSAHVLNLLAKDLLNKTISDNVIKIVKYFRNTHLPKAWYSNEGGSALVLPADVRWNSYTDCFESYIKNWTNIVKVCEDEEHREHISSDIKNKVMDLNIKRNAEHMIEILKPIASALDIIQKEDCSLGQCLYQWKVLGKKLERVLDKDRISKYKARYEQAINPCHFACVLLSPSVLNQDENIVSVDEKNQGLKFIMEKCPNLVSIVANFQAKIGPFKNSPFLDKKVTETMTDYDWSFYVMGGNESTDELGIEFIYQLTTAVASSAGIERQFSSFGIVHSSLRNKLGVDKASKLVFLMKRLNP